MTPFSINFNQIKFLTCLKFLNIGIGFELGVVSNKKGLQYRYGFLTTKGLKIQYLKNISLKSSELEELLRKTADFEFKATFDDQDYNFTINKHELSGAHQLIINGQPGKCFDLDHCLSLMITGVPFRRFVLCVGRE